MASTPRTSGATFCGAVPRLGSLGDRGDGWTSLSPAGDLVFTGTASADAMEICGEATAAPHGDGAAPWRGLAILFGDSVLEGGPKQRQDATIGMIGLGV
ncbi:MAG TPA: hypothetical protein VGK19_05395 [Capsulimonadaceae bacterium]